MERGDLAEFGKKPTQMMIFLPIENVGRKIISKRCLLCEPQKRNQKIPLIGISIFLNKALEKPFFSVNQNLQIWMLRIFSKNFPVPFHLSRMART